jgi:molybdopterin molybdotransferase
MAWPSGGEEESLITVEEAQQAVISLVEPLATERVSLLEALGRVLAEDVHAPHDIPQNDNSAMDGYAVDTTDVATASPTAPVRLAVVDDIPAGRPSQHVLEHGQAMRIMTGAPIPAGADAVVPVEKSDGGEKEVQIFAPAAVGAHIRRRGEDTTRGGLLVADGTPLHPAELGVLASAQRSNALVRRIPRVAILSTGNELVDPDETLTPGKVVNSNSYSLAALAMVSGAKVKRVVNVRDELDETVKAIESALDCDFIISSGGVSVGAWDFVKEALDQLGAKTHFWRVAMKPGKPVVVSTLRDRLFFGLPGNPVSCMVGFHLFVAPSLRRAQGQTHNIFPPSVKTRLGHAVTSKGERRNYMRVRVVAEKGELLAYPMRAQGSGVSTSMLQANGLAVIEPGIGELKRGAIVSTLLIGPVYGE